MIRSLQLVKATSDSADAYCIIFQAGKHLMLAEGSGRQGTETSRKAFSSELEAIQHACAEVEHQISLGFVPATSKNPFREFSEKEQAVFQNWEALESVNSIDEVKAIADSWNWDNFIPKYDTLPLRNLLTKWEGTTGIGALHHQCTAAIVRRHGKLVQRRAHVEPIESSHTSHDGRYTAYIGGGSGNTDGSVRISIWENETGMLVNFLGTYGGCREYTVVFSPDAELLACSAQLNCIELHESFKDSYTCLGDFNITDGWTKPPSVDWSPDGNALLLGMYEAALAEFTQLFTFERLGKRFRLHAGKNDIRWFTVDIEATRAAKKGSDDDDDDDDDDDFPEMKDWKFKEIADADIPELWQDDDYDDIMSDVSPDDHIWKELPKKVRAQYAKDEVPTKPVKPKQLVPKPFTWAAISKSFDAKKSPMLYGEGNDLNENWYLFPAYPGGKDKYQWNVALPNGLVMAPNGMDGLEEELNFSIDCRFGWPLRWANEDSLQLTATLQEFARHPWILKAGVRQEHLQDWATGQGLQLPD
jgi:hypothetical protein